MRVDGLNPPACEAVRPRCEDLGTAAGCCGPAPRSSGQRRSSGDSGKLPLMANTVRDSPSAVAIRSAAVANIDDVLRVWNNPRPVPRSPTMRLA